MIIRSAVLSGRRKLWAGVLGAPFLIAAALWIRMGPLPPGLLDLSGAESTIVLDRSGETLYEARASDGARTSRLHADTLPAVLVDATIAAEDHHFWRHPGIDPAAIARALVHNLRRGRASEGGSTITQQVAKLLLARRSPNRSRGIVTKLNEAVVALRLEHRLGKREIVALYLTLASYGNQLVGAQRASQAYFGCDAALLTPAQAAFLAALPQRPSRINPYNDPDRAAARQRRVIAQMAALGMLSPEAVREARAERLEFRREPAVFIAPHFVQYVLAGIDSARAHRVTTTLDAELQRQVEGIIRSHRAALERHGAHNVAAVVLDNATGGWLAWEGSGDYEDAAHGGAIDGVVTPRQPGSALKPFTYALAFETGDTPATVLPDVPSYFATANAGILYSPKNYDNQYRGPLLIRRALAGSENVPAVALASRLGVPNLLRFLRLAGFTTFDKTAAYYGLGVTLGDAEIRLDELVTAYAMFARGGRPVSSTSLKTEQAPDETGANLVSSRTAFWITDILSDPAAREYVFGRGSSLEFPFPVAAKTGTSQAYRDNWAIGYTNAVTVGVWVGNFDRTPLVNSSGVTGAGPIFHAIMTAAERRVAGAAGTAQEIPIVARPDGLERRTICSLSGMPASRWCPSQIEEWAAVESPRTVCAWHDAERHGVRWPSEYRQWAKSQGLTVRTEPEVAAQTTDDREPRHEAPAGAALRVTNPPPGAIYLIDPTLRRQFQTLPLRAEADDRSEIEWAVDGRIVGRAQPDVALDWPLQPGRHFVVARDARGRRWETSILVK